MCDIRELVQYVTLRNDTKLTLQQWYNVKLIHPPLLFLCVGHSLVVVLVVRMLLTSKTFLNLTMTLSIPNQEPHGWNNGQVSIHL